MQYPFAPWTPDNPAPNTGLSTVIEGAIPQVGGFGPFPQLVASSGAAALPGDPRGIISIQKQSGDYAVYAATADTIQEMQSDFTWLEIENGRAVPDGEDVSFCLFGSKMISTDVVDGLKAFDVNAGGTNDPVSGAPAARFVFQCNNVLFALGTSANPRRFQSSDIGNHARWSGGAAEGKTLEDGGDLVGGADMNNGVAVLFQESCIRGIQFGSGASTYSVNKIADGRGCVAARTIAAFDGMAFWWDNDGPWQLKVGSAPIPIGAEKINRWAAESIGRQNFKNMQATIDPARNLVLWRIDESRLLAYNWLLPSFSILPASTAALARIATPAVSIDTLSGTIDGLIPTIDNLGGGSAPQLGGLNSARKYATFTGGNMAVTIEGRALNNPVTGLVGWATPIDDAAAGTLQLGVSDRLDAALAWKSGVPKTASGRAALRGRGKNIAFRRNIPAGTPFSYVNGVDHIQSATGGPR